AQRGSFFGFETGTLKLDYPRIRARMNEVREASHQGLQGWIEGAENVELIFGEGSFASDKVIQVGENKMTADHIYLNVGTRPRLPDLPGIDEIPWLDSARLLDQARFPEHLIILGGGYIGIEFAQIYRRFGARVTLVQRGNQLMPREDADVAASILEILQEEGVEVLLGAEAQVVNGTAGDIHLGLKQAGKSVTLAGSDLLLAVGRLPNSYRLALQHTAIQANDRGYIQVDDHCQTAVEGVFALGDVNGHGAFTHTSVNDAEIVLDFLFGGPRTLSQRIPVYALFSDPPLGRVGMSEKEALASGKKVLKATKPMAEISRAKEMGETKGFAKLLVDGDTDQILGASILGVGGDEIINMFAAIMHSGIECRSYRQVVLVHPTVSELMPWVLDGIAEALARG
ncbi:MAG: FAD-dependent oxidoreductase, partial [Bacteroidota bacterium]